MNNQLFQLSIATRAGQFIARYSAKGLAELNFPSVGRASSRPSAVGDEVTSLQYYRVPANQSETPHVVSYESLPKFSAGIGRRRLD